MAIYPFPQSASSEHLTLVEQFTDDTESPPPSGFVAYLENACLDDLLQLENQSRSTGVFGVTSGADNGYLHLEAGELIHAEAGPLEGEEALFHILSWHEGRFAQCPLPLGSRRTIDKSLELLLLMRKKRKDELANSPDGSKPESVPIDTYSEPLPAGAVRGKPRPVARLRSVPFRNSTDVVVSPEGKIIQWQGRDTETFASQVAYATRLGALIGMSIGSGQPSQIELRGTETRTVIFRLPEGSLAASRYSYTPASEG